MDTTLMEYNLDNIAKNHDIVLIDTGIRDPKESIPAKIYDCHNELFLNLKDIEKTIEDIDGLTAIISNNPNIYTIEEVIHESKRYMDILNGQAAYHSKNIKNKIKDKKRSSSRRYVQLSYDEKIYSRIKKRDSKIINRKKKKKNNKYEGFDEEKIAVAKLRIYTNKIFILNSILKSRIIPYNSNGPLIEKVLELTEEKELKIDFSNRYHHNYSKDKPKIDMHTDEKIIAAAYELALKENNVGIVSNDSDIKRILRSCHEEVEVFKLPDKGNIVLYSDFQRSGKYKIEINISDL